MSVMFNVIDITRSNPGIDDLKITFRIFCCHYMNDQCMKNVYNSFEVVFPMIYSTFNTFGQHIVQRCTTITIWQRCTPIFDNAVQ